jgi:hypothetical protein
MDVRRAALPALLLLAALAAVLGYAIPAGAGTPAPLQPEQAALLANATPAVANGSTTSVVDGTTALSAALQPDAQTSIEAGITPQAAVGLATLTETNAVLPARPRCWANVSWHQWGTWPYQQKITDTTYWCAVFDKHITYRTSTTTASGLLCGVSWRASALIGGGIGPGFTYFTNRASANFTCRTAVPWIAIHTTHHLDTKRTDRGVTTEVGSG